MMHCPVPQVLRLELKKFAVDVVTIQPGDFSKVPQMMSQLECILRKGIAFKI
jgi:hypothetical protein